MALDELYRKIESIIEEKAIANLQIKHNGKRDQQIHSKNLKITYKGQGKIEITLTDICRDINQFAMRNNGQLIPCIDICN